MTFLLITTEFTRNTMPQFNWISKRWTDRTPGPFKKATVFWALSDSVPDGFREDIRYNWLVDGTEVKAFFTGDILDAWHSESRGTGQISRNPHIIYGERRELNVYEKLALRAPPSSIIPPVAIRRPGSLNLKRETAPQLCHQEICELMKRFRDEDHKDKAEVATRRGKREAEYRKQALAIFRAYGVAPFPIVFPP